nr:glycosyltransferase [Pseudooceanicola aestuarii]
MIAVSNPVAPPVSPGTPEGRSSCRIVNVGRLVEQKDQTTLIEAFARIAPHHPGWTLRILGDGPLRPALEEMRASHGLETRVDLPGATRDIAAEYRDAEIFALSSRFESFGLVTVEAMQHGLPVVAFADCPGVDVLRDKETGLLAASGPDRASAMAGPLDRLIRSPELRQRLGRRAQTVVAGKFDPVKLCAEWENLLFSFVSGGQRYEVSA